MKVEIIAFDSDPNRGGSSARVYSLIRMFAQFAQVHVVLTDWSGGPKVPGVTYEWQPMRDRAISRLLRLRNYYKADFPDRTTNGRPDIVLVTSLDLLGLHQHGNDVPLVLDEHNIYWSLLKYGMYTTPFFQTRVGRSEWLRRWLQPYLLSRARSFEIRAVRRSTRTLVTSETDRRILVSEAPDVAERVKVLPNCIDVQYFSPLGTVVEDKRVLFVGNYNYVPNREAACLIAEQLAPRVPEAEFVLVGSNPPAIPHNSRNLNVAGHLDDLRPALESAAVCIAPILQGSGTRLKLLTYFAAGKAVVSTVKACEGIDVQDGVHLLIRDDMEEFALAIRMLLESSSTRQALGRHGHELVRDQYDWRANVSRLRGVVSELSPAIGST